MANTKTSEELHSSIKDLLAAAEQAAAKSREESGEGGDPSQENLNLTEDEVARHL